MQAIGRFLVLALALGCAGDDEGAAPAAIDPQCEPGGFDRVLVVRQVLMTRLAEDGSSEGFDLDGIASSATDPRGCYIADYVDSEGVEGVDNAFARLIPVLESTEAAALEPLMQDSINNGAMLLMAELGDLDAVDQDECVELSVFKGLGFPFVGADGWITPGQTFAIDPGTPISTTDAALVDGRIEAGPMEVALNFTVLDAEIQMVLHSAVLRLEPVDETGELWTGRLGGGVELDEIIAVATEQNVAPEVFELIEPVLLATADLAPDADGQCQQISLTLEVEAVGAWLYEDAE